MKTITTSIFIILSLLSFSQENLRLEKIKSIYEKAILNCDVSKYGEDAEETKKNLSLYYENYKQKNYEAAIPYWRNVFFKAPKSSVNLYIRGAKMYKHFAKEHGGEAQQLYYDTLLAIHETRIHCYGSSAKLEKNKIYDWYKYRKKGNEKFLLQLFTSTYNAYLKEENNPPANFLSYWIELAIQSDKNQHIIDADSVLTIYGIINEVIDQQTQNDEEGIAVGTQKRVAEILNQYHYEIACEKILPLIEKTYRENPDDTMFLLKTYKKIKRFSCTDSPFFIAIATKVAPIISSYQLYMFLAKKAKDAGEFNNAISYYQKALELIKDDALKEKILLRIASIYYNKGNFVKVRAIANQVLKINPNSGKAYLIIGRTYASSGKICGSGTDFKSHTIVWAALDTWEKAKNVDENVYSEAQSLINKYSQYMPTKQECFLEGIKSGSIYTIHCFGVKTIVRFRKD